MQKIAVHHIIGLVFLGWGDLSVGPIGWFIDFLMQVFGVWDIGVSWFEEACFDMIILLCDIEVAGFLGVGVCGAVWNWVRGGRGGIFNKC